jgi:hypothetical protein
MCRLLGGVPAGRRSGRETVGAQTLSDLGTLAIASSWLPRDGGAPLRQDSVMDVDIAAGEWAGRPLLAESIEELVERVRR